MSKEDEKERCDSCVALLLASPLKANTILFFVVCFHLSLSSTLLSPPLPSRNGLDKLDGFDGEKKADFFPQPPHHKSNAVISQQILTLKLITTKVNYAYNGLEVEWQDNGNNDDAISKNVNWLGGAGGLFSISFANLIS